MAQVIEVDIVADSRYPVDRKLIRAGVQELLSRYGMGNERVLVEISIVGNRKIRELNRRYRNIDAPTDVLSFPLDDGELKADGRIHLGDVVVSYPEARTTAVVMNRLIDAVIIDLVEHGVKHLLGEHHEE